MLFQMEFLLDVNNDLLTKYGLVRFFHISKRGVFDGTTLIMVNFDFSVL